MNFYSKIKEIWHDFVRFKHNNGIINSIIQMVNFIPVFLMTVTFIAIFLCPDYKFNLHISLKINNELAEFLDKFTIAFLIIYIMSLGFGIQLFAFFTSYLDFDENKLISIFATMRQFSEIFVMSILSLKLYNNLIWYFEESRKIIEIDKYLYLIYFVYCSIKFINLVYKINYYRLCDLKKKYTPYFDCDGKQIAENDKLIYNNKLYNLFLINIEKPVVPSIENEKKIKKKWALVYETEIILLDDIIKNENSKIKIY